MTVPGERPRRSTGWGSGQPWEDRASQPRRASLARNQETADKWCNVFAGLLGIFGAVLAVNKPPPVVDDYDQLRIRLVGVIAFTSQVVAYTGWAAAGLPKLLADLTPTEAGA